MRLFTIYFVLIQFLCKVLGNNSAPQTCVIGAGYSGLAAARYLREYGVDFTVYEATRHIGGTWRFEPSVGIDDDGLPVFTSMYKGLRTNTPRQTMEFPGFTFPEGTPSYPTGPCFYNYLKLFSKKYDLKKNIQFQTYVTSVKRVGSHWNVTFLKTDTREHQSANCDFVVIANGQYSTPVWPRFEGQSEFLGTMIHSHDYKDADAYKNRKVLVVGGGASGLDIVMQLSQVAAKVVHSNHLDRNLPQFPGNYVRRPDIASLIPDGAVFVDDTFEQIDDIIFATGYEFNHSYLDNSTGIIANGKYIAPLHRQMVNIWHPSMIFMGIPRRLNTNLLALQAEYIAALVSGKFKLPSQEKMLEEWYQHICDIRDNGLSYDYINVVGNDAEKYIRSLTEEAGIEGLPPVFSEIRLFNTENRLAELLTYRDYDFTIIDDYHYERRHNPREPVCPIADLE